MTQKKQGETPERRATHEGARRRLLVMRSGAHLFAVYADEVEATSEGLRPTPLPFAPALVRGVVSQRGRILTVIDPLPLLQKGAAASPPAQVPAPLIVGIKGDEQLALAVERIEHDFELYDELYEDVRDEEPEAARTSASNPPHAIRRIVPHQAGDVAILDTTRLFEAAMQGVERRRRRT